MAINIRKRNQAYGPASRPLGFLAPIPLSVNRAPTTSDKAQAGQILLFGGIPYINVDGGGTWVALANGSGSFSSLAVTGSITAGTTITAGTGLTATAGGVTATAGNVTATNGNLVLGTAGNKLSIATGANASIGAATLVAGTVTVASTSVTANSLIFLTPQDVAAGAMHVDNIVPGVGFDIVSSDFGDTSTVAYLIIN